MQLVKQRVSARPARRSGLSLDLSDPVTDAIGVVGDFFPLAWSQSDGFRAQLDFNLNSVISSLSAYVSGCWAGRPRAHVGFPELGLLVC